jgi:hypothetical protein
LSAGLRRVDAINTFRVSPGHFTLFHVVKSIVSAAQQTFASGFDSRQLHQRGPMILFADGDL